MNFYLKYQIPIFVGTLAVNHIYHHKNQLQYYLGFKTLYDPNSEDTIERKIYVPKSFEDKIDKTTSEIEKFAMTKKPIIYMNDFIFQGDYLQEKESIKLNGKGILKNKDGTFKMIGNFKDNYLDGPGLLILPDGSQTKCEFVNGKLRGQGIMNLEDYEYRGYIEGGIPKGNGIFLFKDGSSMVISPIQDSKKDYGKMYDTEGKIYYKGEILDKTPNGNGELFLGSGSVYKGNFIKGYRIGYGEWYDKFGDLIYKGEFEEDVPKHKVWLYKEAIISLGLTALNGGIYLWKFY